MLSAAAVGSISVTPAAGDPVVYVDNATGNDSNAGTIDAPIATIAYGRTLLASEMAANPGHGGALLLRRGDVFPENLENWNRGGVSTLDPVLISSYAPAGDLTTTRPLLLTGAIDAGFSTPILTSRIVPGGVNYVDLVGIAFEDQFRDPTNSAFNPSLTGGSYGYFCIGASHDMLVEDCSFQYYITDVAVEDGTSVGFGAVSNFTFEQNVISNSWVADSSLPGSTAKSEGLYAQGVTNITLDGNVFDHDGWSQTIPFAGANIYNHDCYLYASNTGCVVTNNIFADAASHGLQARAGGIVENNLFLRDAIAMSFGFVNGAYSAPGGVSGIVSGNIVIEDKDISGAARGWGLEIGNLSPSGTTVVQNNIYAQDIEQANPAIELNFGSGNSDRAQEVGLNNLTLQNNTVYGFAQGLSISPYFVPGGTAYNAINNVKILNNNFQNIQTTPIIADGPTNQSQISFAGNTYSDASSNAGWFQIGNPGTAPTISLSQWQAQVEPTAQMVRLTYNDATRTAATYNATLGGGNTLESFIQQEDLQSNLYWRPQYATSAVLAYLRAGYTVGGTAGTATVAVNAPTNVPDDTTPPSGSAAAPDIAVAGSLPQTITVTYSDDVAVDPATIDSGNISASGPNGYNQPVTFISSSGTGLPGSPIVAVYSLDAPADGWAGSNDGTYYIVANPDSLADTSGNPIAVGAIGAFTLDIDVAPPVAELLSFNITTATSAAYPINVAYADASGIDLSTLNSADFQVIGPNGYNQPVTYSGYTLSTTQSNILGITSPVIASYYLAAPIGGWTAAYNGTYTVVVQANAVADSAPAPNFMAAGNIGTFNVAVPAPTPAGTLKFSGASSFSAKVGSAVSNMAVASFTSTNKTAAARQYVATINWGDGSTSTTGTITASGAGSFSVRGSHTYSKTGTFAVGVTVKPAAGGAGISTSSGHATVVAPLSAVPSTFKPVHAVSFSGIIGAFTDPNPNTTTTSAFTISINWGDGSAAGTGTATYNSSTKRWNVTGTHKYAAKGTYKTAIIVTDRNNGVSTTINSTAGVV